jgi:hypothetical protein
LPATILGWTYVAAFSAASFFAASSSTCF